MQLVNATDTTPLPVGVYSAFQSLYPGFTVTSSTNNVTTTWLGSSSTTNVPNLSFSVLPVRQIRTQSALHDPALAVGRQKAWQ